MIRQRSTFAFAAAGRRRIVFSWIISLALPLALVASAAPALATNGTWTDKTSGGLWNSIFNWSTLTIANGTDGIADFSTLNITSDNTIHLDTARTIGQLKFGDTTPSNNWILDNDGSAVDILTLAVTSGTPTITVNNDTATISAVLAGSQGLAKSGAGVLLLSGNNTFLGGVTVGAGTLALGNGGALPNGATAVSVSAGATLDLGGQTFGTNALSISGTGVGGNGALINSSASAAGFAGTVTVSAPFRVGGSGDITLSGSVNSANNVLTKVGSNTLVLSGTTDNNSLALTVNDDTVVLAKTSSHSPNDVHAIGQDALTVNGGTAQLGGTGGDQIFDLGSVTVTSGAFDTNGRSETFASLSLQGTGISGAGALVNSAAAASTITPTNGTTLTANATVGVTQSGGSLTLNNAIGGNFGITKVGAGTLTLAGNNTFNGGLTINAGNVQLGNASALNSSPLNSVTFGASSTGTLSLNGNSVEIGDLNGASSSSTVQNAGGTAAVLVVKVDAPKSDLFGGVLQAGGAGALALDKEGTGTLTLSGNNTLTGVAISEGTLILGNDNALGTSSIVVVSGATLDLGGQTIGTNALTIFGTGVGANGALINSAASAASLAGAISIGSPVSVGGTGDITLSGSVNSGTDILTKIGNNTLTLSGSTDNNNLAVMVTSGTVVLAKASGGSPINVHAIGQPGLTVNGGTAQLGGTGGDQIDDSAGVTVSSGGAFDTNGQSETLGGLQLAGTGIAGSGALVNSAAAASTITPTNGTALTANATVGVTQSGGSLTLNNPIVGNFGITKVGAGTLTLAGNNKFTGGLTVQIGALRVATANDAGTNGPLGNTSITLGTAGQSGAGQPVVTLEYTGGTASSTMPFTIPASNGAVQIDNPLTNLTLGGTISGSGEFIKAGPGTLTLAGNNTFSGMVIINAGALQVGSATAINANMALAFGGTSGSFNLLGQSVTLVGGLSVGGPPTLAILTQNGAPTLATLAISLPGATSAVYEGVLQDGGAGPLAVVISGGGTEFIAGSSNSFTGGLTVQQGTLEIQTINDASTFGSLGNNTSVTLGSSGQTGTLEFAGNKPIPSSDMPFTLAAGGTGALQIDNATTNLTLLGVVSGSGGLIKSGPGTLTLAGANTYTGATTVSAGILVTTASGSLGPGPLTISAADGITAAVNLGNNQTVSSLSGTIAGTGSAKLNIGSGVTLTDDQSSGNTAFQGALLNAGTFAKSGTSSLELDGNPTLNANSTLLINGGTLRFSNSGAATISTGVTATVASSATLELAGSASALSSGSHRVNIANGSNLPGLLVSGTHQQVGNIDGSGTTRVNAGSDLTADHIIQNSLIIGGTAGSPALVTIDASDASGNPLGQSSGFALAGSLTPSGPFGAGGISSANLSSIADDGTDLAAMSPDNSAVGGNLSPVPEPSSALLLVLGGIAFGGLALRERRAQDARRLPQNRNVGGQHHEAAGVRS